MQREGKEEGRDKDGSLLIRTGEFLMGITSRKHKVVKFVDTERGICTLKIIYLPSTQLMVLFKRQFYNIKSYIARRYEARSELGISKHLEMQEKEPTIGTTIIKTITKFCEYPTLYDYYRQETLRQNTSPLHKPAQKDRELYIHVFEELFELILRAGGIYHYFYTPKNIYYVPPNAAAGLSYGRLTLNLTSTAGLKFIHKFQVPKDEFIEIFPCLPPNTSELIRDNRYDELDRLMKIRGFCFNALCFILGRVPFLFEDSLESLVDLNDPKIRDLIQQSGQTFKLLLRLEQRAIKGISTILQVELHVLFSQALVECSLVSWDQLHKQMFLQSYINKQDYITVQKRIPGEPNKLLMQKEFFERMVRQLWSVEAEKDFYLRRGLGLSESNLNVYLLIKLNCSFHLMLRWLNVLQLCENVSFYQESNEVAHKLIQLFNNPSLQQDTLNLPQAPTAPQDHQDDSSYNPFQVTWQKQGEELIRRGPSNFLGSVFSLWHQKQMNNQTVMVASTSSRLEGLLKLENQCWLV